MAPLGYNPGSLVLNPAIYLLAATKTEFQQQNLSLQNIKKIFDPVDYL